MNILTYTLQLNDKMSATLSKLGVNLDSTNNAIHRTDASTGKFGIDMSKVGKDVTATNKAVGKSFLDVEKQVEKTEKAISGTKLPSKIRETRNELDALDRQTSRMNRNSSGGGGLAGLLGGFKGTMAAIGATAILGSAISFGSDSISKSFERQRTQTSFNVLAGSETAGGDLTKQLVKLQNDTVLGSEVFRNAQTMMGFGIASKDVLPYMKMLGDVSMGDADKLNSLTLAFSQIQAAGKLQGQDLLQLINAGFNPLGQIAIKTGKSIGQLKQDMEKGKITFFDVKNAFIDATSEGGRFNNMLEKIAETPAGKMQQFMGQWDEFKIKVGTALMPIVSQMLDMADRIMPVLTNALIPISNAVDKIVTGIGDITNSGWNDYLQISEKHFVTIKESITDTAIKLYDSLDAIQKMVGQSQLLKDIFGNVLKAVDEVFWFVNEIASVIKDFVNDIMTILGYLDKAYGWMQMNAINVSHEGAGLNPNASPVPTALTNNPFGQGQWMVQNPTVPQIAPPALPGMAQNQTGNDKSTDAGKAKGQAANTIATGGTKTTHITIHIGEMGNDMKVYVSDVKEGAGKIRDIVLDEMTRALSMAQANATQ